ncbi:MAG: RNA 2',3'-cyclic phosphodiesterase [Bryobacteraceae bacterium]
MRLFTGLDLPADSMESIERLLARLRPTARLKWSRPANLHVTTKFIGEWPEERLEELIAPLRTTPGRTPIEIAVRELGFFPNSRSPRVFWAGVQAGPGLAALARETDERLSQLGIDPEKRAYSPHLTLARIQEPVPLDQLHEAIRGMPSLEIAAFRADRFYLYRSKTGPHGSVYSKLAEFPFTHP